MHRNADVRVPAAVEGRGRLRSWLRFRANAVVCQCGWKRGPGKRMNKGVTMHIQGTANCCLK